MIRAVKSPSVPKFVIDLMSRAKYDYGANSEAGYTISIKKRSYYQTADTFKKEIQRLKAWVDRQKGGVCIVLSVPNKTVHKDMQYAVVTIYDPIMKRIEGYIGKEQPKDIDLCDLMCR